MDYQNYLKKYIKDQRKDLDKFESFRPNTFKHIRIDCRKLTEETGNGIIDQLEAEGIKKESSVLYFMEVIGDKKATLSKVAELK